MFEHMKIAESIYEGVVKPSNKKRTSSDFNRADHIRKMRGEADSSNTYFEMGKSADKLRKRYVSHLKDRSQLACLINGPGNSSDKCKVFGGFCSKYAKGGPTKDHRHDPAIRKCFGRYQENNDIIKNGADEIILQEKEKLIIKG